MVAYINTCCRSKIVFETAGILLEELRTNGVAALARYKVVVLDEVHERSVESDLVLTCAKQLMLRNSNIRYCTSLTMQDRKGNIVENITNMQIQ
jgi:HrpA-like RNA helicase